MLLHLSDLHFGTEKVECLMAIKQFCQAQKPELIVVSGDLTQRAKLIQFQHCQQFLNSLDCPYLVVPGNHDLPLYHLWNRFFSAFTYYKHFFEQDESYLETPHFYVVGVNSVRRRYHTRGSLSRQQIDMVYHHLSQAPQNKLKLVVCHQPFYSDPLDTHGQKDCPVAARLALQQWGQTGLFGILHGHLHRAAVHDLTKVFRLEVTHPIYDIHAGTASSYRLYHGLPNSFNVISITGEIYYYAFDEQLKSFVKQNVFPRAEL